MARQRRNLCIFRDVLFLVVWILFGGAINNEGEVHAQQISLGWDPNKNTYTSSYNIYRATHPDSQFSLIANLPHPDSMYLDHSVRWNNHYYYMATSISIFAIESDFSNRIDTTLQYLVPVGLNAFSGYVSPNNSIILQWLTTSESTNYGFEVQRCLHDHTLFETIGFVKGFGTTVNSKSYRFEDDKVIEGTYQYRLKQINYDGASTFSDIIQITLTVPRAPYLYQNYPNPFNNSTEIAYDLPLSGHVALIIYDETGRQVCRLVDQFQNKGKHKVKWGARDMLGRGVGSGVYYCGIKTISSAIFRRLVYIR